MCVCSLCVFVRGGRKYREETGMPDDFPEGVSKDFQWVLTTSLAQLLRLEAIGKSHVRCLMNFITFS